MIGEDGVEYGGSSASRVPESVSSSRCENVVKGFGEVWEHYCWVVWWS